MRSCVIIYSRLRYGDPSGHPCRPLSRLFQMRPLIRINLVMRSCASGYSPTIGAETADRIFGLQQSKEWTLINHQNDFTYLFSHQQRRRPPDSPLLKSRRNLLSDIRSTKFKTNITRKLRRAQIAIRCTSSGTKNFTFEKFPKADPVLLTMRKRLVGSTAHYSRTKALRRRCARSVDALASALVEDLKSLSRQAWNYFP